MAGAFVTSYFPSKEGQMERPFFWRGGGWLLFQKNPVVSWGPTNKTKHFVAPNLFNSKLSGPLYSIKNFSLSQCIVFIFIVDVTSLSFILIISKQIGLPVPIVKNMKSETPKKIYSNVKAPKLFLTKIDAQKGHPALYLPEILDAP